MLNLAIKSKWFIVMKIRADASYNPFNPNIKEREECMEPDVSPNEDITESR